MLPLKDPSLLSEKAYIDGRWCDADDGRTLAIADPASGKTIACVPLMGAAETKRAIEAARVAGKAWRRQTAKARGVILRKWYELMMANIDDLAMIMTAEQGKPLAESRGEIDYAASFIEWFSEEGKRAYGDTIPSPSAANRIIVTKEPIGVCGAITPWNFPAAMVTRKVAPALAAGCSMVLKPAEATPLSALALAVLAERAGLPAGVLSVITGSPVDIGGELTSNPIVRKLSFTGSTEIGRLLMRQSAATIKKLSLELGGNAPFIVFDDADLDAAVEGAIASKFRNAGQTCVCANRLYVQAGIYDAFAQKLVQAVEKIQVGNGRDTGVTQGPLINQDAIAKVEEHIADALAKGAHVLTGGARHALGGNFFQPTVLTEITSTMRVASEETFGPMAPLFRFDTEEEVLAMANDTEFGLASYLYSRDIGRVWRIAEGLESGMVGVNTGLISNEVAPFGGVKQSGLGREGSHYGLDDYLTIKYICLGGIHPVGD
jgi:succinate-semialdehyde dehydrogenase/glutarate-semialdehyde dehydrogenase